VTGASTGAASVPDSEAVAVWLSTGEAISGSATTSSGASTGATICGSLATSGTSATSTSLSIIFFGGTVASLPGRPIGCSGDG
jgi:hypothetical protein